MSELVRSSLLREIYLELHNLCQPLTALQCRLEMARLVGGVEALQSAVDDGLEQTGRMFEAVAQMRKCLLAPESAPNSSVV
jgi:hypothetical protein